MSARESKASSDVVRVLLDDGSLDPTTDPGLSTEEVLRAYRAMVETRYLDERLTVLQRQGRIGFHVGSLGKKPPSSVQPWRCDRATGSSRATASSGRH